MISPINLDEKQTGERSAGNPHAAFDVAGAGNVITASDHRSLWMRAPVLDPTDEEGCGNGVTVWLVDCNN